MNDSWKERQSMILYRNTHGMGDVLIVYLQEGRNPDVERKGDVARIADRQSGVTLGFNFFCFSRFFPEKKEGKLKPERKLIAALNKCIADAGFQSRLCAEAKPRIVVGAVKEVHKHPDSDHMHVCRVDVGNDVLQIVCGAPNIGAGLKVVVALTGALMPNGTIIRPTILRGVASSGMICAARELGLSGAPQKRGILVLDPAVRPGTDFYTLANVDPQKMS
jgi:tRNA-binding protein